MSLRYTTGVASRRACPNSSADALPTLLSPLVELDATGWARLRQRGSEKKCVVVVCVVVVTTCVVVVVVAVANTGGSCPFCAYGGGGGVGGRDESTDFPDL